MRDLGYRGSSRKLIATDTPGIFQRGSRFVVVFRDTSGRQHKKAARTKAEAKAIKAAVTTDVRRGEYRQQSRITFAQHWDPWITSYAGRTGRGFRENTRQEYRRDLERLALPFFGRMMLAAIEPQHVKEYVTKLAANGYAASTIRNALAPVRAMLADAAEDGLIRFNPAAGVRVPSTAKEADDKPKALTPLQVQRLRSELTDEESRLLVDFLIATGLRVSELIGLDWSDLDLPLGRDARGRARIRKRFYRGMDAPKSKTSRRDVALSPKMKHRLCALRDSREHVTQDDPVFLTPQGSRWNYANLYSRMLQPAMRAAGIDHGGFHRLRHTTGTELRRLGVTLEEIQLQLGHHDLAFTRRVYVHMNGDDGPDPELLDDLSGCLPKKPNLKAVG